MEKSLSLEKSQIFVLNCIVQMESEIHFLWDLGILRTNMLNPHMVTEVTFTTLRQNPEESDSPKDKEKVQTDLVSCNWIDVSYQVTSENTKLKKLWDN